MRKITLIIAIGLFSLIGLIIHNQKTLEENSYVRRLTLNSPEYDLNTKYNLQGKKKEPKVDAPEMHALIQRELRTRNGESGPDYGPNQVMEEYQKAKNRLANVRSNAGEFDFIERGPARERGRIGQRVGVHRLLSRLRAGGDAAVR